MLAMTQKIMDLGDFMAKDYPVRFSLNGHEYNFVLAEATVDEVLSMMYETNGTETLPVLTRRIVTEFLVNHADPKVKDQLREDLATVPYKSPNGGMDLMKLNMAIQQRYEKKDLGDESPPRSK